jgi:hypothetical protein
MKITLTDSRTSVLFQPRNFTVTLSGARGPAGQGLPAGGAEGQIIVKQSATDYDTAWADNYATNVELYVKNSTASPMTKGQVVYVSGADGNNPTVSLAIATSEAGSSKTIGVLKQGLAVGASGYVITDGLLEGLNTNSASAAGDTIWLSPTTAGGVVYGTANKPSAPNHMVFIGYVLRKNTNNGKIFVKIQNGFELQELHNVAISNPVTGQVLKYNATTQLWSNDTDAGGINTLNSLTASSQTFATGTAGTDFAISSSTSTHTFNIPTASASARGLLSSTDWSTFNGKQGALTLTTTGSSGAATLVGSTLNIPQYQSALTNPVTGTGTSGQVAYFNGTSTVTGSANLFWDAVNSRLGVGTNAPSYLIDVNGSARINNTTQFIFDTSRLQISTAGVSGFYGNNFINYSSGTTFTIQRQSGTVGVRISNSDNVLLNSTTDNGQRLQVYGSTLLRGSGTTSSTTALLVQNSTPTNLFSITDNGQVNYTPVGLTGSEATSAIDIQQTWNTTGTPTLIKANVTNTASNANSLLMDLRVANSSRFKVLNNGQLEIATSALLRPFGSDITPNASGGNLAIFPQNVSATPTGLSSLFFSTNTVALTSGNYDFTGVRLQFVTNSGNASANSLIINSAINQTGGANGITRGLYVNPTLTAAADWRGIESVAASNANHTLLKLRNATVDVLTVKADSKIGFWNATPVAQPTTAIAEATFTENSGGTAVNVDSTFAGYTLQQIAQALKDIGILQ